MRKMPATGAQAQRFQGLAKPKSRGIPREAGDPRAAVFARFTALGAGALGIAKQGQKRSTHSSTAYTALEWVFYVPAVRHLRTCPAISFSILSKSSRISFLP